MTRILCFGDLHLDAGTQHRADALADHEHTLEQIAALAGDCDLVLFAGDAFHRPHASDRARHIFKRFLGLLQRQDIPFVGILGNASHDIYGTDRETALELYDDRANGVHISRHPETIEVAGVSVCTLPSIQIARLVAQAGGGDRTQINQVAADILVGTAADLRKHVFRGPSVLLGHWSVSGASLPNGLPVDDLGEIVLDLRALLDLDFTWTVLGHIHNPELLSTQSEPTTFYTGSPMCLDFGEAEVPHGVWILDSHEPFAELRQIRGRRFVTVDTDIAEFFSIELQNGRGLDPTDFVAADIAEQFPLTDAIVRVRYRATEEQHRRVDQGALRRLIQDAGGRCYQIAPDIIRGQRSRAEGVDETLSPAAAIAAWCDANDLDEDRRVALHALTAELLDVAA